MSSRPWRYEQRNDTYTARRSVSMKLILSYSLSMTCFGPRILFKMLSHFQSLCTVTRRDTEKLAGCKSEQQCVIQQLP